MLSTRNLIAKVLATLVTQSWISSTTYAGYVTARKRSGIVAVRIQNVRYATSGQWTTLGTLPTGWAPAEDVYAHIDNPQKQFQLRARIRPNGIVDIYNYSTSISYQDTNATATITFPAA